VGDIPPIVRCKDCRNVLDEDPSADPAQRQPCPHCGSLLRCFDKTLAAEQPVQGSLGLKARHGQPGEVRPHHEQRTASSYWRDGKKWVQRHLRMDHEADEYEETVTDPETGETIYHSEEKLSEHRGHGDDRSKHGED
jgi:hypothetical protein